MLQAVDPEPVSVRGVIQRAGRVLTEPDPPRRRFGSREVLSGRFGPFGVEERPVDSHSKYLIGSTLLPNSGRTSAECDAVAYAPTGADTLLGNVLRLEKTNLARRVTEHHPVGRVRIQLGVRWRRVRVLPATEATDGGAGQREQRRRRRIARVVLVDRHHQRGLRGTGACVKPNRCEPVAPGAGARPKRLSRSRSSVGGDTRPMRVSLARLETSSASTATVTGPDGTTLPFRLNLMSPPKDQPGRLPASMSVASVIRKTVLLAKSLYIIARIVNSANWTQYVVDGNRNTSRYSKV